MRTIILSSVLAISTVATASDAVRLRGGGPVGVIVAGRHEKGIGLKSKGHGWELDVEGIGAAELDLTDVTRGALPLKWTVLVSQERAELEQGRFIAGHAYRVQVRKGAREVQRALVYLYPPDAHAKSRVDFEEDSATPTPAAAPSNDDGMGISIVPKNAL